MTASVTFVVAFCYTFAIDVNLKAALEIGFIEVYEEGMTYIKLLKLQTHCVNFIASLKIE